MGLLARVGLLVGLVVLLCGVVVAGTGYAAHSNDCDTMLRVTIQPFDSNVTVDGPTRQYDGLSVAQQHAFDDAHRRLDAGEAATATSGSYDVASMAGVVVHEGTRYAVTESVEQCGTSGVFGLVVGGVGSLVGVVTFVVSYVAGRYGG
ncbi:hypothetical protein [Halomarina oriensis]|uniref:DUF7979 domain-containing protein n=1 Tax=Halomarina oriensis TaxID=671145 RepID=A0A6B0GH66_9EURY|nr:hypothetical protein [Halomarina oriensis]MWG34074.1 hypothetical protein [Halomarina oriensis]